MDTLKNNIEKLKDLNGNLERTLNGIDIGVETPARTITEKVRGNKIKVNSSNIVNYRIYGNIESNDFATPDNPTEIKCVGDLVTDAASPHYGKYKISYTVNGKPYNIYLTEPLRGTIGYGYSSADYTGLGFEEYLDYIDFKSQTIVRKIKEVELTESSFGNVGDRIYNYSGKYFLISINSSKNVSDLSKTHPVGSYYLRSDIVSTHAQRFFKDATSKEIYQNDCLSGANTANYLYYYFLIDNFNLQLESATSNDYSFVTASGSEYFKIKDENGNYMTTSELTTLVKNKLNSLNAKAYCPLAQPVIESIEIEPIDNNDGEIEIVVNTETESYYIEVEYVANLRDFVKKTQEQEFFKDLQKEGSRRDYQYAFYYWSDRMFKPIYPLYVKQTLAGIFRYSEIEEINVDIYLFYNGGAYTFADTPKLKTIKNLVLDSGQTYSYTFLNATALENINITGVIGKTISFSESSKLTKASIASIVNALAFWQGATLTLSKVAVDKAFESADGANDGSTSQEWINLISSKSNQYNGLWTISLV